MLKFGFDLDGGWLEPQDHVESARVAEAQGYDSVWMGDHFLPWYHTQAQAPAVWPWLGVALAKTEKIKIGPSVTIPIGGRYHPLLIGQNAATLDNMFPGRFMLGVGTGQAMSEYRFLGRWPDWKERGERMREGLQLIRKLWDSQDYFDWSGKYFSASKIYLYTRPAGKIPIVVSARGKYAARIAGELGDHLITTVSNVEKITTEILPSFDNAMKKTGRDPSKALKMGTLEFAIGDTNEMVRKLRNSTAAMGLSDAARNEMDPRKIQELSSQVTVEDIIKHHHLVASADELIDPIQELVDAGLNYVVLAHEGTNPNESMKAIAKDVIPQIKG
jgi:coenzyme F420-dependent glucose-6-phosphate dehydrogenase